MDRYIENKEDANDQELLIKKEDILRKFISYIEFWREKNFSKSCVIFIIKFLRLFILKGEIKKKDNQEQDEDKEVLAKKLRDR